MDQSKLVLLKELSEHFVSREELRDLMARLALQEQAIEKANETILVCQNAIIDSDMAKRISTTKRPAKVVDLEVPTEMPVSATQATVASVELQNPKFPQINNYIKNMMANVTDVESPDYVRKFVTSEMIVATEICKGIEQKDYDERKWKALGATLWEFVKKDQKSDEYIKLRAMHTTHMSK